jgi:hypothetical protein
LTDFRNYRFRPAFLAKVSEQKQNSRQPHLARIEKLIDQVLFKSIIARNQISRKNSENLWSECSSRNASLFSIRNCLTPPSDFSARASNPRVVIWWYEGEDFHNTLA